MHECDSAEHLALFPLHVQLTKNHIHDNDKVSHKRPVDNTRTEVCSVVTIFKAHTDNQQASFVPSLTLL